MLNKQAPGFRLIAVAAGFFMLQPASWADTFTQSEIDIADTWMGAAVSAKFSDEDAEHDYDGQLSAYSGELTFGMANTVWATGSCTANVVGAGNGVVQASAELLYHGEGGTNIGTSSQSLKPFIVEGSGTINTSITINFDGLLVVNEGSGDADDWSQARVDYLAEIQQANAAGDGREIVGSNTFEGMALIQQYGGAAVTTSVPQTFNTVDFPDEYSDNTWYNNSNLSLRQVVAAGAGAGQINLADIPDAATRNAANTHLTAGRTVYYLVYGETFNFDAQGGQTYYVYMDLNTSTTATDGDFSVQTYAAADFSNTVNYDLSGGDSVTTQLLFNGAQGIGASNPFGGATTQVVLNAATLNVTANGTTANEKFVLQSGTTNTMNTNANTATVAGVISGSGALTKTGAGTLILGGANTYTGGTTVSAGTLQTNAANRLPSTGSVAVANGATLDLDGNNQTVGALSGAGDVSLGAGTLTAGSGGGTSTFSGDVSGTGGLTKTGSGTLTLSGTNTATGALAVNAGTASVTGTWAGDTTLASGATLMGNGTLTGDVSASGSVKPGNSIGTLVVGGNYTQSAGSALEVEFNNTGGAGNVDLLDIAGTATIQSGTTLTPVAATTITQNLTYTFLDADGGITGSFGSVVDNYAVLDFALAKAAGDTEYQLTVTRLTYASAAGGTQTGAAQALDSVFTAGSSGDMTTVLSALDGLSTTAIQDAYAQVVPDISGGAIAGSAAAMNQMTGAVGSRQNFARSGLIGPTGFSTGDGYQGSGFWMQGLGHHAEQGTRKGVRGFQANTFGTAFGADRQLSEHVRAGLAMGYSFADINSKAAGRPRTDIDSYQATLYGSYDSLGAAEAAGRRGQYYADALLAFAHNEYEGEREIRFGAVDRRATSDYSGQQYTAKISGGYTALWDKPGIEVTPLASLEYSYLRTGSYVEGGNAGALALSVDSEDYHQLEQGLGLKLAYPRRSDAGTLIPALRGMWLYDYAGERPESSSTFSGGGPAFITQGAKPDRHTYLVGAELAFFSRNNLTLLANYDAELKDEYAGHAYSVTARWDF